MTPSSCVRACGLNSLVVYFNVKTHDVWEGDMPTRSEIQTKKIYSLRFWDIREGVTLRRLIFRLQLQTSKK